MVLLYSFVPGIAATRVASVSGNWSNTATWGGAPVPTISDDVKVNPGITLTVDVAAFCNALTYNAITTNSAVTILGTNTLSITGTLTMPMPAISQNCTMNINAGTLSCGFLTMSANGVNRPDIINISTGSLVVSGTISTVGNGCKFNLTGPGTFTIGAAFSGSPTLSTVSGSTVIYSGASAQTIYPIDYLGNLELTGPGTKTISDLYSINSVVVHENFTNSSTLVLTAGCSLVPTYLLLEGNAVNNAGATITATGDYTELYFNGTSPQTFTNNGTVTAPLSSLSLESNSTLTLSGSSQIVTTRVNLFNGTIVNSNRITLGSGGTSYATVQRGVASNAQPAGSFDVAPLFDAGSGGYYVLYTSSSVAYYTGFEIPSTLTCNSLYLYDAADVTLNSDVTVSDDLNFAGTGNPVLRIGAHTMTLGGTIAYTLPGSLYGGSSSNLVMNGATTLNGITGGLNNLTVNASTSLAGALTVNGMLILANGWLINGSYLTMASGSTISRSGGDLYATPAYAGTVNLVYSGSSILNTGKEIPLSATVVNNLNSNALGLNLYAYTTSNTLTDYFPNLTSWSGNKGSGSLKFNTYASAHAGGVAPEAGFYSSELTHSNATYFIYSNPVNTSGFSTVNISFKSYATGNYTQNYPTYLKLQSSTNPGGPWHDVWSMPYAPHGATNIVIPGYTTDVGGSMYFQFAFVGDAYALDYWYFDNLIVDGIVAVPATATINGTFSLSSGAYSIGAGNSLVLNGTVTGAGTITGETNAMLTVGGTIGGDAGKLLFTTGGQVLKSFNLNRSGSDASVTIGTDLVIGTGGLTISSGLLKVESNKVVTVNGDMIIQ